jgi:hypothetical protein
MNPEYLVFLLVGELLIFFGGKFAKDNEIKIKFFNKLFSCNLCLGVWVYTLLSLVLRVQVFDFIYIPVLSELITGCVSSFLVFLLIAGWKSYHEIVVI